MRAFPARLLRAKQQYEITHAVEVSWAWVAEQAGKSTSVMSQIKTGDREPTLEEVAVFAALFGVRVEWLAFQSGPITAENAGSVLTPENGASNAPREARTIVETPVQYLETTRPKRKGRTA